MEYLALFAIVLTARVRPRARLPLGRWHRRQNHALAPWRRGLRQSAATARRNAMEHRSRAAGECGSGAPFCGWLTATARWAGSVSMPDVYACLSRSSLDQSLACSSSTSSPSIPSMAARFCARSSGFRLGRARSLMIASVLGFFGVAGFGPAGPVDALHLDGPHRRLRRHELLERLQNRPRPAQPREDPAPPGFCLSQLPHRAARRPDLALQSMRHQVRHLRDRRRLPALFRAI